MELARKLTLVYIALIGIFAVYISTHKLMLGSSQFQQPNVEGGDVYRHFIQISSPMIHLGLLKI